MISFSFSRPRAGFAIAALAVTLAAAGLVWWYRAELSALALKRLMAGGPVAELQYSGLELGVSGAELAELGLAVETPLGRWVVAAEGIGAGYVLGAAELTEISVRHARLGFQYRAVAIPSTDATARRGGVPLPLQRLRVQALEFDWDSPWGHSRFNGEGELARGDDGTVTLVIRDAGQSIRAEFPPDFAAAMVAIERLPQDSVMRASVRGLNRPDRRVDLQVDATPALGWLADSALVPEQLRVSLKEPGVDRIAPVLEGLSLAVVVETADGFHSLHGTAVFRKGERGLVQAEIGKTAAGLGVHGSLQLPVADVLDLMRPLLPETAARWQVSAGVVSGAAEWHRTPAGLVTARGEVTGSGLALVAGPLWVDGAEMVIHVTDPFAPAATGIFTASVAQLGTAVRADHLAVEASLSGRAVSVRRASLGVFGGTVDLEPALVQWGPDPVALTLRLRELDLSQMLAALSQPGLSGSGTVSGTLPVRFSAHSIELEEGRLTGSGPGVLRYQGPAADDGLAFRALRNFAYRRLQARADYRPNGDYGFGIRLEGHNPEVLGGHPIAFNLKLSGRLPELLQQGILAGDFERPVLELYESAHAAPKPGQEPKQRKPPPADRRNR